MKTELTRIVLSPRQVALCVRIVLFYDADSIVGATVHRMADLRAMAEQKLAPSPAVLNYLQLEPSGSEYVWDPAVPAKPNQSWGPALTFARPEVLQNGAAIHHAVRTVESSFANI